MGRKVACIVFKLPKKSSLMLSVIMCFFVEGGGGLLYCFLFIVSNYEISSISDYVRLYVCLSVVLSVCLDTVSFSIHDNSSYYA